MAKNVFRPTEVVNVAKKVFIQGPDKIRERPQPVVQKDDAIIFSGPTVDELRREAEEFRLSFEKEKEEMLTSVRGEADAMIREAEERAFLELKRKSEEAARLREEAEQESSRIIETARVQAETLQSEISAKAEEIRREAHQEGFSLGREDGYAEGKAEADRLVERLHLILSKAIEKRTEIIDESETQLVSLVLLIARKVVKVISENQKSVVANNVIHALRKLKNKTDVVIRVHPSDLRLTSAHSKDFMRLVENARNITVMEDTAVDRGGCIVETDFGLCDARISSQLTEIEEKVLELMPIRSVKKPDKAG